MKTFNESWNHCVTICCTIYNVTSNLCILQNSMFFWTIQCMMARSNFEVFNCKCMKHLTKAQYSGITKVCIRRSFLWIVKTCLSNCADTNHTKSCTCSTSRESTKCTKGVIYLHRRVFIVCFYIVISILRNCQIASEFSGYTRLSILFANSLVILFIFLLCWYSVYLHYVNIHHVHTMSRIFPAFLDINSHEV